MSNSLELGEHTFFKGMPHALDFVDHLDLHLSESCSRFLPFLLWDRLLYDDASHLLAFLVCCRRTRSCFEPGPCTVCASLAAVGCDAMKSTATRSSHALCMYVCICRWRTSTCSTYLDTKSFERKSSRYRMMTTWNMRMTVAPNEHQCSMRGTWRFGQG